MGSVVDNDDAVDDGNNNHDCGVTAKNVDNDGTDDDGTDDDDVDDAQEMKSRRN